MTNLKEIMSAAWTIARRGAKRFGGSVRSYLAAALRQVWSGECDIFVAGPELLIREVGPYTVTHNGTQFLANGKSGILIENARKFREVTGADLPAGKVAALLVWASKTKRDLITLTSGEYFRGKSNPESKRLRAHHNRDEAAARFWDGMNENRDGYNPYRA